MKIYLSPQISDKKIKYKFNGEIITATINDITDIFDLSNLQEGDIVEGINTTLTVNPVIKAKRKSDGILYVELLNFTGEDAVEKEKFPEWQEV